MLPLPSLWSVKAYGTSYGWWRLVGFLLRLPKIVKKLVQVGLITVHRLLLHQELKNVALA